VSKTRLSIACFGGAHEVKKAELRSIGDGDYEAVASLVLSTRIGILPRTSRCIARPRVLGSFVRQSRMPAGRTDAVEERQCHAKPSAEAAYRG
jgi:hypothetical protein